MSALSDRLVEITEAVRAAVRSSSLTDRDLVTVSNNGADFVNSKDPTAGAVIVYAFPKVTIPAPRGIRRVTWTLGIVATGSSVAAAARCGDLLDVVTAAGIVAWRAGDANVDPTDFAISEDPKAPRIPGWAISITEEHLS